MRQGTKKLKKSSRKRKVHKSVAKKKEAIAHRDEPVLPGMKQFARDAAQDRSGLQSVSGTGAVRSGCHFADMIRHTGRT